MKFSKLFSSLFLVAALLTGNVYAQTAGDVLEYNGPSLAPAYKGLGGIPNFGVVYSTAQVDVTSSTTLVTVTGLTRTLAAGKVYQCSGHLYGTAGGSGGVKVALVADSTLTATSSRFTGLLYNGTTLSTNTSTTSLGNLAANTAAFTDLYIEGIIVVNVGGVLSVQAAQNASNGTATSVYANSDFGCIRLTY